MQRKHSSTRSGPADPIPSKKTKLTAVNNTSPPAQAPATLDEWMPSAPLTLAGGEILSKADSCTIFVGESLPFLPRHVHDQEQEKTSYLHKLAGEIRNLVYANLTPAAWIDVSAAVDAQHHHNRHALATLFGPTIAREWRSIYYERNVFFLPLPGCKAASRHWRKWVESIESGEAARCVQRLVFRANEYGNDVETVEAFLVKIDITNHRGKRSLDLSVDEPSDKSAVRRIKKQLEPALEEISQRYMPEARWVRHALLEIGNAVIEVAKKKR